MSASSDWETFFNFLSRLLNKWECSEIPARQLDYFYNRLENCLITLHHLLATVEAVIDDGYDGPCGYEEDCDLDLRELKTKMSKLSDIIRGIVLPDIEMKQEILAFWNQSENSLRTCTLNFTLPTGKKGRPPFVIDIDQVVTLRCLGFRWKDIANVIGVSVRTLHRRRKDSNIGESLQFTSISDSELQDQLIMLQKDFPDIGERMCIGFLRRKGIFVPRQRVREALHSIDPINTSLRWHARIKRRCYSVPGPMSLWHIDGNHKLIRWGLVIHGGIDGYSRLVVFLRCSDNNRATTVQEAFLSAVSQYGVPSRLRCDQGRENMKVAELMLEWRGLERRSVLVGSSVHNQRIERLWRDLFNSVTQVYYRLFYHLESCGILDPLNPVHLFCLHFVFLPRINRSLLCFTEGWNNHPMSTCKGQSPLQQYAKGIINGHIVAEDICIPVNSEYGYDDSDFVIDTSNDTVNVPKVDNPLSVSDYTHLQTNFDPLQATEDFGIGLYEDVLLYVQSSVQ